MTPRWETLCGHRTRDNVSAARHRENRDPRTVRTRSREACHRGRCRYYGILFISAFRRVSPLQSKPNLVFVATRVPYPPVTGHYLRTLNILHGLAEHFTLHFFGFWDRHGTAAEHARAADALREFCSTVHLEYVGAERSKFRLSWDLVASLCAGQPFAAAKYRSRSMHKAIRSMLASQDVAAIHADSLQSGQYLIGVSHPKLLTNHNVEFRRLRSYAGRRSGPYRLAVEIQARLTKRYERRILRGIGNCVAVSESDRDELSRLVPEATFFVVRNGADISAPPLPRADPAARMALWVGGMNDPFNREGVLHFASRILPRIRERLPDFLWRVVGRDPPPTLCQLARDPSSGVELAGFVPELRDAYGRCAIVVVPLFSGGGTKLKVLEAMAVGRAVVTTPIGAEGIGARDGLEMAIASSDEEFATKVCDLMVDPDRRDRISTAARALAEREFGWDAVNREMYTAVESVIAAGRPAELATECAQ
jgi:glycosyltransferase involved in cell wall biosynthesis